ncbi:MAG: regulatory protein [Oceanicoccus sp.]|jgi:regulatory protein
MTANTDKLFDDDCEHKKSQPLAAADSLRPVDIRRKAMDVLAGREHGYQELFTKLHQKIAARYELPIEQLQAMIEQQLQLLVADNLQSDQRYVEAFINGRKAQGKGPLRIRQELEQKRVAGYLIEDNLHEDDDQWLSLAERVYRKKFGSNAPKDYQEKSKRLRFMQYRGFGYQHLAGLIGV